MRGAAAVEAEARPAPRGRPAGRCRDSRRALRVCVSPPACAVALRPGHQEAERCSTSPPALVTSSVRPRCGPPRAASQSTMRGSHARRRALGAQQVDTCRAAWRAQALATLAGDRVPARARARQRARIERAPRAAVAPPSARRARAPRASPPVARVGGRGVAHAAAGVDGDHRRRGRSRRAAACTTFLRTARCSSRSSTNRSDQKSARTSKAGRGGSRGIGYPESGIRDQRSDVERSGGSEAHQGVPVTRASRHSGNSVAPRPS